MNPRLIATLCALASTAAVQAQEVTLYGRADMALSLQSRNFANGKRIDGSLVTLNSGGYSGSRIGFRGKEDLGRGYTARFVLEQGIQLDTGAIGQGGRAFGRQSYVGLDTPMGQVTLGRQYTPWFDTLSLSDAFGNNLLGNAGNLIFANARADNAVLYRTPDLAGFTAQAMTSRGDPGAGRQTQLAAHYQRAGWWAGAAYGRYTLAGQDGSFSQLGSSYDFGTIKAFVHVARLSGLNPHNQAAPTLQAGAKATSWMLGGSATLGSGTLMATVIGLNDQRTADRDARQYAVGYLHPLSKRTLVYGGVARIVNTHGGALTVNTPSYAGSGEAQVTLGISHAF